MSTSKWLERNMGRKQRLEILNQTAREQMELLLQRSTRLGSGGLKME